jgi:hypothetical protein
MAEIHIEDLPHQFFIPKYLEDEGYCLQLIETTPTIRVLESQSYVDSTPIPDISPELIFKCSRTENIYWYLPMSILDESTGDIPIIDTQYMSWVPSNYKPVHLKVENNQVFTQFLSIRRRNLSLIANAIVLRPVIPIVKLPSHVLDALLRDAKSGKESCPISMTLYSECDSLSITSCFHIFDKKSLALWFENNSTCPLCRKDTSLVT